MEVACRLETLAHIYKVPPRHIRQERRSIVHFPTRGLIAGRSSPLPGSVMSVPCDSLVCLVCWYGTFVSWILSFFLCTIYSIAFCILCI